MTVLPLLVLGLLMFQLDRMNLASALTAGFAKDIYVSQDTINLGNQLMFMGTVVLEIPCNLLLQRVSRTAFCIANAWRLTTPPPSVRSTKMDLPSVVALWPCRNSPSPRQESRRLPRHPPDARLHGGGLHSGIDFHAINMVYEARADQARCHLHVWPIRW